MATSLKAGLAGLTEVPVALNPKKRIAFELAHKERLSHNVTQYRFALQSPQHKLGLPVGKHVFLYAMYAPAPCPNHFTVVSLKS